MKTQPCNHLLAALPPDVFDRIAPTLETMPLVLKHVLQEPGEPVAAVYFPGGGFCSMVTVLSEGMIVEAATVGREGVIGMPGALTSDPSPIQTMVQAEAPLCYRMSAQAFRAEMQRRDAFHDLMSRYAYALLGIIAQSSACNAAHTIEQRLARWLLMAHDRVGRNEFALTQEFVAAMLGVSRPTVTVVAGVLQRAGLITYRRGHLTILNREELEQASCECYRATADMLQRVTVSA